MTATDRRLQLTVFAVTRRVVDMHFVDSFAPMLLNIPAVEFPEVLGWTTYSVPGVAYIDETILTVQVAGHVDDPI